MEPHYIEAQWPPQSTKGLFVWIDAADVKLPGNNQRVSNSVFKVTRIIYIVEEVDSDLTILPEGLRRR